MSEEKTEVIRTVATVSVHPEAALTEAASKRLSQAEECLLRTVGALREIAAHAGVARDSLEGLPTNMKGLLAFESIETVLRVSRMALSDCNRSTKGS